MAGFTEHGAALAEAGIRVLAASVDPQDKAREVAAELDFPVAWGVDRALAGQIGAWWDERRGFIQPSEFVLGPDGRIVQSSYSAGPLARTEAADVLKLVEFLRSRG